MKWPQIGNELQIEIASLNLVIGAATMLPYQRIQKDL